MQQPLPVHILHAGGRDVEIAVVEEGERVDCSGGGRADPRRGEYGSRLKIMVAAPPLEGRANEALVAWLAEQLGLPRRLVRVTSGLRSRDKTLRADGIRTEQVLRLLAHQ